MKFWSLIVILIVAATTILYTSNAKVDISEPIQKWQSALSAQLSEDSVTLLKYFNSDDDRTILSSLDASLLSIEVSRHDSIIYWNENVSASKSGIEDIVPVYKYSDSFSSALLSIDIPIINKSRSQSAIQIESHKSASSSFSMAVGQSTFKVKRKDSNQSPWLEFLAWTLLFLAMVVMTFYLAGKFRDRLAHQKSLWPILTGWLLTLVGFKGLHYFQPFEVLFGSTSMFWSLNENSIISQSLAHLMINLWIFGSIIYVLSFYFDKYQDKLKYPLVITLWSGFYTYLVFGIACSLIEGFIMSPRVNLEIED
ncbi:MAG: hypothetical protein WAU01_11100, partial [Saprospiraceae bacterium]